MTRTRAIDTLDPELAVGTGAAAGACQRAVAPTQHRHPEAVQAHFFYLDRAAEERAQQGDDTDAVYPDGGDLRPGRADPDVGAGQRGAGEERDAQAADRDRLAERG